ncbi:maleylpyruvate isomerase family mycothiol-dependent enzyme [Lipingzhangella sp. LS1_29]|uniref:Maleylpyruvate isomerase family mycothiol-dependent enzyme n=1 Tax=Lipingzhangella rawalii TaxID=2055835 RepID=A0ABU2H6U2_9ACTN|nr:maleylpyruvate isomerase family mycothiol-dependent enzyme [Lipingzhangella rawalii]MDS1270545.1 maleylpyruvate isomerase family mycothiol-dependent enzyme [Lipingzhangella rawalii]
MQNQVLPSTRHSLHTLDPAPVVAQIEYGFARLDGLLAEQMGSAQAAGDLVTAPSHLPGWSRGHVLTHLEQVAHAIAGQAHAALRSELVDMYPGGPSSRDMAIEAGASRSCAQLRSALEQAAARLSAMWQQVKPRDWQRPVRFRSATLIDTVLCMWREIEIHSVDVDLGYRADTWSAEFCTHLVEFLRPRCPEGQQLVLIASDADQQWTLGTGPAVTVTGPRNDLAAWLAGRVPARPLATSDGAVPELGPWP